MNRSKLLKIKFKSVMNTTRKITNINIDGAEQDDVNSIIDIVKKFSTSVVDFKLNGGGRFELTCPELILILSSIPNVINLSLVRVHHKTPQGKQLLPSNKDLNLNQLKMLSIEYCSDEIVSTFNRLPAGILSEIKFRGDSLHLFKNQVGIKKLIMESRFPTFTNDNLFDDLQLESCEWQTPTFSDRICNIKTLLSKQTKLKSLKLKEGDVNANLINFITKFTELEALSISIRGTNLKQIGELKNLKELTLEGTGDSWEQYDSTIKGFAELDNSRITTLHINTLYYITATEIAALAKSLPNLKFLRYNDHFDQVLQDIMENFTFVEGLEISCNVAPLKYYQEFTQGNYVNPKLIQLKLYCEIPFNTNILKKLITDYPNLEKLMIQSTCNFTAAHFKQILEGFSKMESLYLREGASALNIKDVFKLLKAHKNIKFIAFGDIHVLPKDYAIAKKKFMKMFNVVEFNSSKSIFIPTLQMAVGKSTFKSEKVVYPLCY